MHEAAFNEWGAVPEEILYDRMRTIWTGTDERGEIIWNAVFLDFARYWGFTPRLCRPYRAQTKGKVESGVKYVRRNFLCGLQGREPANLADLNAELRRWIAEVANQRVHGTTHEQVLLRWDEDQFAMQAVNRRPPYPYMDDEQRKVARDAYVSWHGSRYSVPWQYAGKEVWVRDHGRYVEVRYGAERVAVHVQAVRHHQVLTLNDRKRPAEAVLTRSGGAEFSEAFVEEAVADMREEEAASGLSIEESLILSRRELEVAIDVAGFAESQVQDLLLGIVRDGSQHLRVEL